MGAYGESCCPLSLVGVARLGTRRIPVTTTSAIENCRVLMLILALPWWSSSNATNRCRRVANDVFRLEQFSNSAPKGKSGTRDAFGG
jgi:hypothetical protein